MKVNKLFGVKSITNLIYGLLLLAPFVGILSRVIYVQSNDYAKDSYYGETINQTQLTQVDYTKLKIDKTYIFNNELITPITTSVRTYLAVENIIDLSNHYNLSNINNLEFFMYPAINATRAVLWTKNNDVVVDTIELATSSISFQFKLTGMSNTDTLQYFNYFYEYTYNKYSYLDNAFEYSLYTFVEDNDVQSIDFFSWFTNMFLNQNNTHNALYLNFANWYLNYTLLVSSGYLLFFALMWFINYVRKMLEKSSYHDFGGF